MKIPDCPVCNKESTKISGRDLYPHRPDLFSKEFYQCTDHKDYYVGCHRDGRPLGVLANKEHRILKSQCHNLFDQHWLVGFISKNEQSIKRKRCYSRLASDMGIPVEETHFGMFSKEQCKQAIDILKRWK